jgi:spermidine synthase
VIDVSKKYLPNMAKGFSSPKAVLHVGDGFEYLKNNKNQFDVIITDSSDPEGIYSKKYIYINRELLFRSSGIFISRIVLFIIKIRS